MTTILIILLAVTSFLYGCNAGYRVGYREASKNSLSAYTRQKLQGQDVDKLLNDRWSGQPAPKKGGIYYGDERDD